MAVDWSLTIRAPVACVWVQVALCSTCVTLDMRRDLQPLLPWCVPTLLASFEDW